MVRRKCRGGKCARKNWLRTKSAYVIPKEFACAGMRGPATTVITRASYGWSKQHIDDQNSSGLSYGPRPFIK